MLGLVNLDAAASGPDHLRGALQGGFNGVMNVAANRVPLAYSRMVEQWWLLIPGLAALIVGLAVIRYGRSRTDRALAVAILGALCARCSSTTRPGPSQSAALLRSLHSKAASCTARSRCRFCAASCRRGPPRSRRNREPRHPLVREAVLSAAAAAGVAAALAWLGPPGTDFAAHAYQRTLFLEHGFTLWNNFWYAGRYSFVTYSLLYYPLAALLGIRLLAVATVALAALAFAVVLWREWGATTRWSSRTFAVVWAGIVLSAAFPFALGMAFALIAIWALQAGKRWRFAVLAALTLAASPLSFLLLVIVLAGVALARRESVNWVPVAGVLAVAAFEAVLWRVFPGGGASRSARRSSSRGRRLLRHLPPDDMARRSDASLRLRRVSARDS